MEYILQKAEIIFRARFYSYQPISQLVSHKKHVIINYVFQPSFIQEMNGFENVTIHLSGRGNCGFDANLSFKYYIFLSSHPMTMGAQF